jgi:nitroreductase
MEKCNDLLNLIKGRRTKRLYIDKKIDNSSILSIIEAGIWAPSGCNNQEIRFFILQTEEELNKIREYKPFLKKISHFILILADMNTPFGYYYSKDRGKNLPYIDAGLALQNMIIYAENIGISSCICNLTEYHTKIKKYNLFRSVLNKILNILGLINYTKNSFKYLLDNELKIPKNMKIICGVALGYSNQEINPEKIKHGKKKIQRDKINNYILNINSLKLTKNN